MSDETSVIGDVFTGGTQSFPTLPHTRGSAAALADKADVLDRRAEDLHTDTSEFRRAAQLADLEARQAQAATESGPELLERLSSLGFAWRDIARIVGVSVPAVQKWRRGAGMTGENRLKLAKVVALDGLLKNWLISETSSWLEMPIKEGVGVSGIDLLAARRYDLVLELARSAEDASAKEQVLDSFDPMWRSTRVDAAFEAYRAADGRTAIRARSVSP